MLRLDTPLRSLEGIGPRRSAALARLGYATVEDLLHHLPFRYEDRSRLASLGELREGERATVLATIVAARLIRTRRRGFTIFEARLEEGSASVPAVWYNQPYLVRSLTAGRRGFFYGELRPPRSGRGAPRFENPQFEALDPDDPSPIHTGRIVPVYERIGPLTGRMIRTLVHAALEGQESARAEGKAQGEGRRGREGKLVSQGEGLGGREGRLESNGEGQVGGERTQEGHGEGKNEGEEPAETQADIELLPAPLLERLALAPREEALRSVHFAPEGASLAAMNGRETAWHRRLVFDEFFLLQLGLALRRSALMRERRGHRYLEGPEIRRKLRGIVPFRLTPGQRRALGEIAADLRSPHPMNRLLQGDVGCGKTIVAVLAMALAAESGLQSALMAPTEILARQHAGNLRALLEPAGYRLVLVTSSVKGRERRDRLAALASGEARIAVGTHALAEQGVVFGRLGLVVIDEQHRFGVMHRARLREKGAAPDTLVMTATPIPRSLAMTLYGDLDLSIIDDMPPGRTPVRTLVRRETDRARLYEWMRGELAAGKQAFIVYPLVEEKEESELRAAKAMARRLATEIFPGAGVGLVHGRLPGSEKTEVMERFRDGRLSVLVATTVVEVGIDVPNATILVVEHAERFGLSQLHQLRGRVGRGRGRSTCVLVAGERITEAACARLEAIEHESSGFRLAEIDLEQRGPGELLGTRQTGLPALRVGNLVRDRVILEEARREAFATAARGEADPEVAKLALRLREGWMERFRLAGVG